MEIYNEYGKHIVNAIKINDGKAIISDECRICGRCAEICPNKAIDITIEDIDFIEKTIERVKKATC